MRVLHINSESGWRGGEQQMANLISHLSDMGVTNFICSKSQSEVSRFAQNNHIHLLETSFKGLKLLDGLLIKKFVKENKIDLIHTHSSNAHTSAFLASVLGLKIPIIVSKRTDFRIKSRWKYNHKNIKKIICVSNKIKEIADESIDPAKTLTIYSGINPARFLGEQKDLKKEYNLTDKPLIGNCSAIAPHKDYYTFLKVAKVLPEYNFIIIGSGPLEEQIKSFAREIEVNNVTFTGHLKDLGSRLSSLDAFLITSETEGLGTSILDAMICELPVVATGAGGIPEIVIHEKTGLLSEIRDHNSLAQNCKRILTDSNLKNQLIQNAKKKVCDEFTDLITAEKTYSVYKDYV